MIIECINCNKKFEVNSDQIPDSGRTIQCGSCNHIWFFKKTDQKIIQNQNIKNENLIKKKINKPTNRLIKKSNIKNKKVQIKNSSALIKYESKSKFSFSKLLSYILVAIISFIGLIIILDTFKSYFYVVFPNLETILFNLFETLKDINLFIKDLI